jgi:large subunit ribosomal protein L15
MQIGELNVPHKKQRKRIGRGPGSGSGKTAGRGHNGQRSRSGYSRRPWFEGGQMPLQRRVPKRGFNPLNKLYYQLINLSSLEKIDEGQLVDLAYMKEIGLIKKADKKVKILGNGELTKKLVVHADAFSKSAIEKIAKAGGETSVVDRSA